MKAFQKILIALCGYGLLGQSVADWITLPHVEVSGPYVAELPAVLLASWAALFVATTMAVKTI